VYRAERLVRAVEEGLEGGLVGDVAGRGVRLHAQRPDLSGGLLEGFSAARADRDVSAFPREREGDLAADAAAAARDDHPFAGKSEIHEPVSAALIGMACAGLRPPSMTPRALLARPEGEGTACRGVEAADTSCTVPAAGSRCGTRAQLRGQRPGASWHAHREDAYVRRLAPRLHFRKADPGKRIRGFLNTVRARRPASAGETGG
jgi:hypothetical protein